MQLISYMGKVHVCMFSSSMSKYSESEKQHYCITNNYILLIS